MTEWKEIIRANKSKEIKITFACTGNIIRSTYAEYIAKKYFSEKKFTNLIFDSGACKHQNRFIHPLSKKLLLEEGYSEGELLAFKPRYIEYYLDNFNKTTIFIGMTKEHLEYLQSEFPNKSFLIKEMILDKREDVLDPYYYPDQGEKVMKELKELILKFCNELEILLIESK